MFGFVAPGQGAAMYGGMQCFDTPAQNFGEAGQVRDLLDGKTDGGRLRGSATSGDQFSAQGMQRLGKADDSLFLCYAEQCAHASSAPFYIGLRLLFTLSRRKQVSASIPWLFVACCSCFSPGRPYAVLRRLRNGRQTLCEAQTA